MTEAWPPLFLVLIGIVVCTGGHHFLIWLGGRGDRLHLWAAAWCGNTMFFLASRYAQVAAQTPEGIVLAARLSWLSVVVIAAVMVGLSHALTKTHPTKGIVSVVAAMSTVLFILVGSSDLVMTEQVLLRTDLFGNTSAGVVPGPLVLVFVPSFGFIGVYCLTLALRAGRLPGPERRAVVIGFAAYACSALNDLLYLGRVFTSVRLFDFGFVGVSLGLAWIIARRYNHLTEHLAHEVVARTSQLTALLGAMKSIATGLDVTSTLERIVEEAHRLTRSRFVGVLLLDHATGLLRPAAYADPSLPQGLVVPLGMRYSGIVAQTGQPLFVADTQSDPDNPVLEHDRQRGIVTYLGLPIQTGDTVLGVLTVRTDHPKFWTDEEMACFRSFADQAAIAITNAGLYATETAARREAQAALTQVRQLQGMLPICAWCKRVRNDANYWERIESYISQRSQATFSHGICPDCRVRMESEDPEA